MSTPANVRVLPFIGRRSIQYEFREGGPKSVVVPEAIDTIRKLIFQNHQVNYRGIETTKTLFSSVYIQYCKHI